MTFVIAKVTDPDAGKVTLFSDTKITDQNDGTSNRRTLSNPGQKVVIVDDDVVVVGFAGDTPASAVNRVAELRGQSVHGIEDALRSLSAEMHNTAGASKACRSSPADLALAICSKRICRISKPLHVWSTPSYEFRCGTTR
jgi:hypothetical protein